jgi:hypothetical protein
VHWMQNQTTEPEDYLMSLMSFIKNWNEHINLI